MEILEPKFTWKNPPVKRSLPTDYIILHHAAAAVCSVQEVHTWHVNNGWIGIGYHFFVRKNGDVWRGRPLDTIGSHALGFNGCSVGICAEGNYTIESMPTLQKNAITALCKILLTVYPHARIIGHSNALATDCPGGNYPLEEIQRDAHKTDLPGDEVSPWAATAWQKAKTKNVTDGTDPQGACSREMVITFLDRLGLLG